MAHHWTQLTESSPMSNNVRGWGGGGMGGVQCG